MTKPKAPRKNLDFAETVLKHLGPELAIHGFVCQEATSNVATFESPAVLLAITHDTFSYELEATFVRKADRARQYTLGDMLAAFGSTNEEFHGFQADSSDDVVATVKMIADLLRTHGKGVLAGDAKSYEQMSEAVRCRSDELTKRVVQEPIRKAAEEAWRRHEYAKVRDLYQSIEADLGRVEEKRLQYARNHSDEPE